MTPSRPAPPHRMRRDITSTPHIVEDTLYKTGFAILPGVLDRKTCLEITEWFDEVKLFRQHIVMARHNFGRGEYRYFNYPLPPLVQTLREAFYALLAPMANRWTARMGTEARYPADLEHYLERCHRAGQPRPTPLLLRYGEGDYNCLHQDRYGEELFPLQVALLLNEPGADFEGGEFVLTEQRPRMQSRPMVVPLRQGDALIFASHQRPVAGTRGDYRVTMRHGVSAVRAGGRHTLGLIFHDAI